MSTELTPFAEVVSPTGTAATAGATTAATADPTLGRLAVVAEWFAARTGVSGPLRRPRSVILAGDATGPDGTVGDDSAAAESLAAMSGVDVRREDIATGDGTGDNPTIGRPDANGGPVTGSDFRICSGHPSAVDRDVLTRDQAVAAVDAGRRLADHEIDAGADLIIPGLAGRGHAVPLGVLTAVLTGLEPVAAIPVWDTEPVEWMSAVTDLRDALFRIRDQDKDAISLIAAVGGADVGALAGLIAQAAARRTPVLLDGLPATVAAVLAHRLAPGADGWFIAAGEATGKGGRRLQDMLGLATVAALDTDSPSGAGGIVLVPLIQAALSARTPAGISLSKV